MSKDLNKIIGKNLKRIRKNLGYTQEDIGGILDVSFQQAQKYEYGTNRLSLESAYKLCDKLGVDLNEFFKE